MKYEYGCDMRGMLSFQIMWLLSRKPMHGEELARELEKRRGEKPKAGTIYPALKEMSSRGLIKGAKEGKIIVYSLTPQGKRSVKHAMGYFCRCFGEIFEEERA
ncbi:MAG: PadR family transcriptional regulator [Candidatus Micrarchaeota archaeon]|nr:PadR family transcriptional regulator [Candidatus Micrarchaeota archaeon]MDE1804281.1 PadR family transcriptional regulator [Candidatus Micrarchaeota archaeon]MDE1846846.1 PadR family transcriptional regulator [Candidatus Micrarchaeota archaeon]